MAEIYSGIACNLDANILSASYTLFEESKAEAIEWSFDALYKRSNMPAWFLELLQVFASSERLIGHGIFFSLFSGRWSKEQEQWLDHLHTVSEQFRFDHITEHFGFMSGKDFHHGAPLPIPYTQRTLDIGRDRLARIFDASGCAVGLENLAFAYTVDEVKRHGDFLAKLIEPVNGFIILDLHNLYCHLHNFSVDFDDIIGYYPLSRVREIHISGGSWESSALQPDRKVRRDTHDDKVPDEVFALLEKALPLCPALRYVIMEQVSSGLQTKDTRRQFYNDFLKMQQIVKAHTSANDQYTFLPADFSLPAAVVEDEELYAQQRELSDILETADSFEEAHTRLQHSSLAGSEWHTERWAPYMLETAVSIAQKWMKK